MDLLMTVVLLLVSLLISNIISHYIPFIPTALTQIAFGIIIALLSSNISFEIEAEWFLLLFVAPILYNDGRHFPREELWKMRAPILGNALVLVLLTAIGGGYFIHWLIEDIPLAAAFALAAILSPTDPVAVNGIAKRIHIPEKVLNLVRGESLINDASGLVAFNYAVAAVVTGYFSLHKAIIDFTYMFFAGAFLGLVLGLLVTMIRFSLRKKGINDVVFHSLLQILTPFVIFIITEELLHASGVIAVVVAGIVHALVKEHTETLIAEEQVLTENIWSIILFTLNGLVFLLLGLNIPSSMIETVASPNIGNWLAIGYVAIIGLAILGIRFIWSFCYSFYEYRIKKLEDAEKPDLKITLLTTLTGVRGAVTMVGVLSIPFFLADGKSFPERSLILFLAAGVILFTLVLATVLLPLLSKRESAKIENTGQLELHQAKSRLLLASIKKIKLELNEENEAAAYELINEYKMKYQRIQSEQNPSNRDSNFYQQKIREIRLLALNAERKYIHEAMKEDCIEDAGTFEKFLDYREEALLSNVRSDAVYIVKKAIRDWKRFNHHHNKCEEHRHNHLHLEKDTQLRALQSAVDYLEDYSKNYEWPDIAYTVILDYKRMINHMKHSKTTRNGEKYEELKEELRIKVIDIERSEIQSMYESGEINSEKAKELRMYINHIESVILYKNAE